MPSLDLLPALVGFAFAMSVTPGPNNLMLLASGANFGLRRSVPHLLGVSVGHSLMVLLLGLGLAALFERIPGFKAALAVVSVLYLLWLAWKFATAAPKAEHAPRTAGRPLTFLQAAAFQWVNPKGWAMALTALAAYTADESLAAVLLVAGVFFLTNLPCITLWALGGLGLRPILSSPGRLRWFNRAMAALIVATLWPVLASL
ncbi:LysE family transporter [Rubellimicrobium sp. CFH 75288]|nr:LysE family translocator [Rubellimicrobium sp. CFH 75288]NAZ35938.1 LysE family transporter [Rubellimicrobium sp. CFH 75288]